jgi:hypothetical protein
MYAESGWGQEAASECGLTVAVAAAAEWRGRARARARTGDRDHRHDGCQHLESDRMRMWMRTPWSATSCGKGGPRRSCCRWHPTRKNQRASSLTKDLDRQGYESRQSRQRGLQRVDGGAGRRKGRLWKYVWPWKGGLGLWVVGCRGVVVE